MNAAKFKKKWSRYQGKETSAYQEHFSDLCRLLDEQTPNEADPSGTDFFCYQKRVVKDAELFDMDAPDASEPTERGFADVWKKDCFAWEYKGKKKNLDEAYKQLLRYRESFLYVSLQLLLSLEKEVIAYATQLGFAFKPQVNVQQLRAIEINPYAFELAQVSVQIG